MADIEGFGAPEVTEVFLQIPFKYTSVTKVFEKMLLRWLVAILVRGMDTLAPIGRQHERHNAESAPKVQEGSQDKRRPNKKKHT